MLKRRETGGQHSRSLNTAHPGEPQGSRWGSHWGSLPSLTPSPTCFPSRLQKRRDFVQRAHPREPCAVITHSNGRRLSPQAAKQPTSRIPCTPALRLSGRSGSHHVEGDLGPRSIPNFPPHPVLLPSFFVEVNGGFGSHGLHLALNCWLIPVVSMETDIGRDKYIGL